jgi:hypothetical protein
VATEPFYRTVVVVVVVVAVVAFGTGSAYKTIQK